MGIGCRGILLVLALLISFPIYAQQEDIFGIDTKGKRKIRKSENGLGNVTRGILGSISLELSGGYGQHFNYMDFQSSNPQSYPISALPEVSTGVGAANEEIVPFDSKGSAIPFNAGVKIDMFGVFTLGAGYGRESGNMASMTSRNYQFDFTSDKYVFDKLYGTLGLVLYDARRRQMVLNWKYKKFSSHNTYMQAERKIRMRQDYPWRFVLEGEYGSITVKEGYDRRLTATEPYYGLGLRIEREFSEYTKVFLKPNAEFRKFNYELEDPRESQAIDQQIFTVNLGLAIRMPGTKRCKFPGCGVKMKHLHNGVEYRGSSIWQMQNRKVGQWY
ncbi:hypothetical protein GCM10028791_30280 [Echinicola sediminis]